MCLAIPGKVIHMDESREETFRKGKVSFDGVIKEVNLALVPEVKLEDYVLVHVGAAISIIDEEEARKTFEVLDYLDELDDIRNSSD